MNERIKELIEQAGLSTLLGNNWLYGEQLEEFAELVREDERKRLNGVTAHEQMLIDGQQSLLRGKR